MKKPLYFALLVGFVCTSGTSHAVEPAREFLQGLRDRGYHDVALAYLDAMEKSRLAPQSLKLEIELEKAITLIEASRAQRDPALREKSLNDAQILLKTFTETKAAHPKVNSAVSQLGNLIVERARMKVEISKTVKTAQEQKKKKLAEAKPLYDEAFAVFTDLQEKVKVQLERIPKVLDAKNKQQARMIERRTQLRADYLQTQLLAAAIREETADTLEEGSAPFTKVLEEAAALYSDIYRKYRTRLAGLYARMYQGRANQRLGKFKDALGYYTELLDQPDEPAAFRDLKTKTLRLAMECWLHPTEKKYMEAIKQAAPWVQKSRPTEDGQSDWMAIRMSLAKAYKMRSEDPEAEKREVTNSIQSARKLAQFVAKRSGEFQDEAKQMVADLGGPDRTGEKPDPTNFTEAKNAGKAALNAFTTANLIVSKVPARVAAETDAAEKAKLQEQLKEAQLTVANAQQEAIDYYQLAVRLADDETSIDDINVVRYFICYLYYASGDSYRAALMGDFVARRYPDSAGARDSATIAMASYAQIYGQKNVTATAVFAEADTDKNKQLSTEELQAVGLDGGADKSGNGTVSLEELAESFSRYEVDRIVASAEYIVEKWPEQPAAQDALVTLVPFMINSAQLDRAQEYIEKMPESSPRRGDSELKTGQAMWGTYLRDSQILAQAQEQGTAQGDVAAEQARLTKLKQDAEKILLAAYGRIQETSKPDRTTTTALLSLAQASLESGHAAKAVEVLEHATLGPLTLANANSPHTAASAVKEETYKTALRSYISLLATDSGAIDKAKKVMEDMKAAIGGNAEGEKRLVSVYVNLAQDLEKQLASATPEAKRALSQGFETFLNQLGDGSTELSVLNWVAESFAKLGASLDDGETLNEDAKKYYQQSLAAFQTILDKVKLDDQLKTQVLLRMATLAGQTGDFEKAIGTFEEILSGNAMMLNVQVEAAKVLELWAQQDGQQAKYNEAISGASKAVWGWAKIANTTFKYQKFRDTFHEARIHLGECRLNYAMIKSGDAQKNMLNQATQELSVTAKLIPDLGGNAFKARYDQLLKKIQTAQGERAVGLKAFESKAAAGG
ncbi:MAG: hypothetical protein CMJ64_10775 [Planctomycetaceae bacterium]|nr:hypothetical protein [Planctomycetaceae bacterium]